MTDRFELYGYWRTSATYRVRVALNLKGVTAKETNINLDAGENRSPEFLKLNPMGAIPALIDHEAKGQPPAGDVCGQQRGRESGVWLQHRQ